jgi:hypothetical protein
MIQTTSKALLLACMAVLVVGWVQAQTEPAFDLVITNGHIMDGTDSPWYSGDVGIRAGKIAAIAISSRHRVHSEIQYSGFSPFGLVFQRRCTHSHCSGYFLT